MELQASHILGKQPTTKQHASLFSIFLTFIHNVACAGILLCYMAGWYFMVQVHYILFKHSPVCCHFGCLYPLAIVDRGIVNTGVQDSTRTHNFSSFGHTCRSGNVGSYGSSMFIFLRRSQAVFTSQPLLWEDLIPPHPCCKHLLSASLFFPNPAFLVGVEWHLTVDLNCIFPGTVSVLSCILGHLSH